MGKLCEEGNVCRDFHKSFWEGRCYLGGTCCLPHLYFLLEMKQYALKLCSSVSSQDFVQLALLPSWAESTLLTLGKREEGLWCYKTLGKRERGDDTEGQPSLPCTHKMQHSRGKLSCTPPRSNSVDDLRAGNTWDHPTETAGQTKVWRRMKRMVFHFWRDEQVPLQGPERSVNCVNSTICLLHLIENKVIGKIQQGHKTIMPHN